jgi:hypothetical protein
VAKEFVTEARCSAAFCNGFSCADHREVIPIADGPRKARAKQIRHGKIYGSGKRCVI